MRHLEPKQLARRGEEPGRRRQVSLWPTAVLLTALALGGGFAATRLAPPSPADNVQQSEVQKRADDFATISPLQLTAVPAAQTTVAIGKMGLTAPESAALAAQVGSRSTAPPAATGQARQPRPAQQQQRMGLVEIALWDTHAPDGDIVLVTSGGYSREVLLTKTPTVVAVPGSGAGTIQVTGLKDGGGGITLGIKGATESVMIPIMSVGQTIALPVLFP